MSVSMSNITVCDLLKLTPFQDGGHILPVLGFGSHAYTESNGNTDFTNNKECLDGEADEQDSGVGTVVSTDVNVFETDKDSADHVARTRLWSVWSSFLCEGRSYMNITKNP